MAQATKPASSDAVLNIAVKLAMKGKVQRPRFVVIWFIAIGLFHERDPVVPSREPTHIQYTIIRVYKFSNFLFFYTNLIRCFSK